MTLTRSLVRLAFVAAVFTSAGCATVMNGRSQAVRVLSEPDGAAVYLNGRQVGTTPATITMRRRGGAELRLVKDGFTPVTVSVGRGSSWWLAGNAWVLNPLGAQGMDSTSQWAVAASSWFAGLMVFDHLTGGAYVRPKVVSVPLVPASEVPGAPRRLSRHIQ